jgi:6-phospho-beta-glucosidase
MIRAAGGFPGLPFEPDLLTALGMIPNEYLAYYYYAHRMLEEQRTSAQTRGEFLLEQNSGLLGDLARLHAAGKTAGMLDRYHAYSRSEARVRSPH